MLLTSFKITSVAVAQIFLLSAVGFILVKRKFLQGQGLEALSQLVIEITLPLLIFCQLIKDFRFNLYPNWWLFPLLSLVITVSGIACGFFIPKFHQRWHAEQTAIFKFSRLSELRIFASGFGRRLIT